jgi:transposase
VRARSRWSPTGVTTADRRCWRARAGIVTYVPKTITSNAVPDGRFGKDDFVYHASSDSCRCPAGETLTHHCTSVENSMHIRVYWASGCGTCAIRMGCTTGKERRVRRWEHEHAAGSSAGNL